METFMGMPRGRRRTFFANEAEERMLLTYLKSHSIGEAADFFGCHPRTVGFVIARIKKREAQSAQTDGPSSQQPNGLTERNSEDTSSAKPGDSALNDPTHGNHH